MRKGGIMPIEALMKGLATEDGHLAAYGPGPVTRISLADWRTHVRVQQVAFELAAKLTIEWLREFGESIPKHRQRCKRQAKLIHTWRPWEKSTGPKTPEDKAKVLRNADKGGTWKLLCELSRALREQRRALYALNQGGDKTSAGITLKAGHPVLVWSEGRNRTYNRC
jgi:hypothetical protein